MSRYCDSLSSQRGQIIEGPANHIKAFGPDPDGSVEGFKRRTGQRSAEHSRVLRQSYPHSSPAKEVLSCPFYRRKPGPREREGLA